jgi:ribosome recycling factor
MSKAVEHFIEQLTGIVWAIPTAGLIDTIRVDYHGQATPIKHLANTGQGDGRIKVEPYDPTTLGAIEKALKAAGYNAYVFSKKAVCINLPKIAGQADREKVIAQVRKLEEEAKVAIRNIRKNARNKLRLPEDEQRRAEKELQVWTDDCIVQITSIADKKVNSL